MNKIRKVMRALGNAIQTDTVIDGCFSVYGPAMYTACPGAHAAPVDAKPYDMTQSLIDYEEDNLDEDDTIYLFQQLVNSGLAWTLQGHYGRTASAMIRDGLVISPRSDHHAFAAHTWHGKSMTHYEAFARFKTVVDGQNTIELSAMLDEAEKAHAASGDEGSWQDWYAAWLLGEIVTPAPSEIDLSTFRSNPWAGTLGSPAKDITSLDRLTIPEVNSGEQDEAENDAFGSVDY